MSSDSPNVLFIMDDQHNARCLGCYGNDTVETPAIDRLAAEGVRFDRAYCQNPICMPSRMSYMTGRYPHSHGVYGNYGGVPDDTLSLARHLGNNGYDTGGFGKLHLPIDWTTHGFDVRRTCDFSDVADHPHENDYYQYLERVGYSEEYDLGPASTEYPHTAFVSNIPAEHSVERWTADETLRWLRERNGDDPFFAWMSFQRPHPPYCPPPEYADLYDPAEIDLPPRDDGEFDDKPPEWQAAARRDLFQQSSDADISQVVAYYYALITLIDEQIGRVLSHLWETGELENTVVVFGSDHGDFAGEHGLVRKNVGISEAVHRIPMVWRWPEGARSDAVNGDLVESIDVFPTLCDLLDLPVPDPVQGESLAGVLAGDGTVDREVTVCEDTTHRTIRTDEWKLTHYVNGEGGELYHISEDPWEHDDLYDEEEYRSVRLRLTERLLDFYATTEEPVIPGDRSAPREGETEAHTIWTRRWWEHGGATNPTPLDHLGGPGYSIDRDDPEDAHRE
ncbi:MAG: sulfatase [Halobacteriales archaeon]